MVHEEEGDEEEEDEQEDEEDEEEEGSTAGNDLFNLNINIKSIFILTYILVSQGQGFMKPAHKKSL